MDINKLSEIISHINDNTTFATHNEVIADILDGNLLPYVEQLMAESLSKESFKRAKTRIPPINVLQRMMRKLSTLYKKTPTRSAKKEEYASIVEYYTKQLKLDEQMHSANYWYNAQKGSALEPFIDDEGIPCLRSIPFHKFTVFSDNPITPDKMNTFVKFMGTEKMNFNSGNPDSWETVHRYFVYTKDSFEAIYANEKGDRIGRLDQFMQGNPDGINPYESIPFIYINSSKHRLIPVADTSTIRMSTLIPALFADINYGAQYQSYSLAYGINIETSELTYAPDTFISVHAAENIDEKGKPELGVIEPKLNIIDSIKNIKVQLAGWQEQNDIRPSSMDMNADNFASGLALEIANMDTTENVEMQKHVFENAERELWKLIGKMHNFWVSTRSFSDKVPMDISTTLIEGELEVDILYAKQEVIEDQNSKTNRIALENKFRFKSKRTAIEELNPKWDEARIDKEMERLKEEEDLYPEIEAADVPNSGVG